MFDLNRRRFITTSATAVAASGMAPLVAAEEDLEHIVDSILADFAQVCMYVWGLRK